MSSEAVPSFLSRAALFATLVLAPAPLFAQGMCAVSPLPDAVTGLGSFLDSTKLVNDLSLAGNEVIGLAALHFQSNGRLLRAVWLEAPGTPAVANALPTAVPAALKNVPRGKPFGVRVRVTGGATPSLAMLPSQYCPPEPVVDNMNRPPTEPANMSRADRADFQRAGPYRMQIEVDSLGRPGRVNMIQSSGSAVGDRFFIDNARLLHFTAPTLDGLAAPGMYEMSVRP